MSTQALGARLPTPRNWVTCLFWPKRRNLHASSSDPQKPRLDTQQIACDRFSVRAHFLVSQ
jgi:hypothetical protein